MTTTASPEQIAHAQRRARHLTGVPMHSASTIAVAERLLEGLESGCDATASAIATLPALAAKLREFGRDDLAARIDAFSAVSA